MCGAFAEEDLSCWLICEGYVAHREAGGEPDPAAEQILAEVAEAEDSDIPVLQHGRGIAH